MNSKRIFPAAVLAFAIVAQLTWAGPKRSERPARETAEYLYGMPETLSMGELEDLIGKPTILDTMYYIFDDAATGERRVSGYADLIAVFDAPIKDMLAVSADFEGYPRFLPRVLDSRIDSGNGSIYRVWYDTGVKLLGIQVSYKVRSETVIESVGGSAIALRSKLIESLDGSLYEHFVSIYLEPVVLKGRPMTFVRYFNRPGIRKPSLGTLQIVRLFAPSEGKAQVLAFGREAVRRAGDR